MKFKQYRRTTTIEMATWEPTAHSTQEEINKLKTLGVIISTADLAKGSPKLGDMIVRSDKNPKVMWLVAEDYFKNNYKLKRNIKGILCNIILQNNKSV